MKRYFVLSLAFLPLILLFLLFYTAEPATTLDALPPTAVQLDGPVTVTMGMQATFTATVSPPLVAMPLHYDWIADGQTTVMKNLTTISDTQSFTWANPGVYTVEVRVENTEGLVTNTHSISVLDLPITSVFMDMDFEEPLMIGETITFTAGSLGGTNVSYSWEFGDGNSATGQLVTHTYSEGGNFEVEVTASNTANSMTDEDVVEVELPSLQFASVMNNTSETSGIVTLTVQLSEAVGVDVKVDYATSDSAAVAGEDYIMATGTLTFTAGDVTEPFTITVNDDLIDEMDEAFRVTLSNAVHADLGPVSVANVLIADDDNPPSVSIADAEITEGDSGTDNLDFTVSLDAPSGRYITVNYITSDSSAVAPDDFTAITNGVLSFDRGVTEQTISVPIVGELLVEPTEHFAVQLTSAVNVVLSDTLAYGTIYDTDVYPTISFANEVYTDTEICEAASVALQLSNPYPEAVWVMVSLTGGTASGGVDYMDDDVKVQFEPGETTANAYVHICRDTLREDTESIMLSLTDAHTATITTPELATLWIQDATYQLFMPMSLRTP